MSDWCVVLYSGPNAISVSLSPMGCYVMVGLASRRILLHPTTDHMVAQVFRLQQPHGGETSIRVNDRVYVKTGQTVYLYFVYAVYLNTRVSVLCRWCIMWCTPWLQTSVGT